MSPENPNNDDPAGDGGQLPPPPPPPESTDPEPVFQIRQPDGSIKEMTVQQVQEHLAESAERVRGANKKFEQAAQVRKELAQYKQIMGDFAAAQAGDDAALRRLATYEQLGLTPEMVEAAIAQRNQAPSENGPQEGQQGNQQVPAQSALSDEDRQTLATARAEQQERKRVQVIDTAMKIVDKDPDLCNIISKDASGRRKEGARNFLEGAIRRRVQAGERGTTVFQSAVNDLKQHLKDWGALSVEQPGAGQDGMSQDDGSLPDALAAFDFDTTGTGQAGGVHRTSSPPQRVASSDPNFEGYLEGRLAAMMGRR